MPTSGLFGFCAVPAGGVAALGCAAGGVPALGCAVVGELAGACAAAADAGVSPAAAKAIAHPISLIRSPDVLGTGYRERGPASARSISAGFQSLKRVLEHLLARC